LVNEQTILALLAGPFVANLLSMAVGRLPECSSMILARLARRDWPSATQTLIPPSRADRLTPVLKLGRISLALAAIQPSHTYCSIS
jgi:hypothetical protein